MKVANDVLSEPIEFEWNKGNIDKNFKKHRVTNEETEEVFFENNSVLTEDLRHSKVEKRYQILGKTEGDRLLNVIFTIRAAKIRIISARDMNKEERKLYEKENK